MASNIALTQDIRDNNIIVGKLSIADQSSKKLTYLSTSSSKSRYIGFVYLTS